MAREVDGGGPPMATMGTEAVVAIVGGVDAASWKAGTASTADEWWAETGVGSAAVGEKEARERMSGLAGPSSDFSVAELDTGWDGALPWWVSGGMLMGLCLVQHMYNK